MSARVGRTAVLGLLKPRDVRGSAQVDFLPKRSPAAQVKQVVTPVKRRLTPWPTWGMTAQRTRYAAGIRLKPPFRELWVVHGRALIELPPAVGYNRLFFGTHSGAFDAVSTATGATVWQRRLRHCMASAPAVARGVVYVALMGPAPCTPHQDGANGGIIALDAKTGRSLWMFHTGIVESSPLLVNGILYFASYRSSTDSTIVALDVRTHRVRWSFHVRSKIAGSASLLDGTVYIGSYGAKLYALDARTGTPRWVAQSDGGGLLGLVGMHGFCATPSIAYGRAFIGSLDGRMYSFSLDTGRLMWARYLGGYVYSSAAVYRQTVYVGSDTNSTFRARDAATGDIRWTFQADGRILGSPTVVDGIVYFSTFHHTTYALNALTGKQVWTFPDGEYTPVIADQTRLYLVGQGRIYGLEPDTAPAVLERRGTSS